MRMAKRRARRPAERLQMARPGVRTADPGMAPRRDPALSRDPISRPANRTQRSVPLADGAEDPVALAVRVLRAAETAAPPAGRVAAPVAGATRAARQPSRLGLEAGGAGALWQVVLRELLPGSPLDE